MTSGASDPSTLPPPPYSATDPNRAADQTNNNTSNTPSSISYSIYRPIHGDYKVLQSNTHTPAFYVETNSSVWSLSDSDLIVHRGSSDTGAELARCSFRQTYFDVGIFKTPSDKTSIVWMSITPMKHQQQSWYRFNASVRNSDTTTTSSTKMKRSFIWKDNSPTPLLVDEETRVVAAAFHEHPHSLDKCGVMDVTTNYGPEFGVVALTTYLALYEKRRRDQKEHAKAGRRRRNGAAGANMALFGGGFAGGGGAGGFAGC